MLRHDFSADPQAQRQQLRWLALALAAIAAGLAGFTHSQVVPLLLAGLAGLAAAGAVCFRRIGRDVFLVFALLGLIVGHVVSWVVVILLYVFGISVVGALLRQAAMNRLDRDFAACRRRATMFVEAPATPVESFGRQS